MVALSLAIVILSLLLIACIVGIWVYKHRVNTGVSRVSVKVATVAVFSALSLGTDYLMTPLPNIKLMDSFVFVAAFLFGVELGLGVATMSWLVYGFANPYGQAGTILVFLIIGECFYAIIGGVMGRTGLARQIISNYKETENDAIALQKKHTFLRSLKKNGRFGIVFGLAGLLGALAYDVLTNTATWFLALYDPSKNLNTVLGQSFFIGLATMNFPLPMGLFHQASDMFFFAVLVPRVVKTAARLGWMPGRREGRLVI